MKKDILISVYNMEIGGIERSLINMLKEFDYEKYNIDLLIYEHKGEFLDFIPNQVRVLPQVNEYSVFRKPIVQCIKEGHLITSFMRIMSRFVAARKAKLRKLKEGSGYIQMQLSIRYSLPFLPKIKKHYDVAISYAWPHDIITKKINASKKIAWIHTDYSKLEIDNDIDLPIWNKFNNIGAVSEECAKAFLAQYPMLKDKVFVMENINSPNLIRQLSRKEDIVNVNESDFNIASVGRLSYAKGFDMAIEALKVLHEKGYTNIKWYVVGYGSEENRLKEMILRNNLKDHFFLLGKMLNPYPIMKNADLYVQPSRYEGKAVTVTEAKILGKPILITNYPTAQSQVLDNIDGVITVCSIEGLVNGIEHMYNDKALRARLMDKCGSANYGNENELQKLYENIEDTDIVVQHSKQRRALV